MRRLLGMLRESDDGVGEAGDGARAVELLRSTVADVVLMDVRMPRMDGIEATRWISVGGPKIIILRRRAQHADHA